MMMIIMFYDDEHEDVDVDDEALRTKYIAI